MYPTLNSAVVGRLGHASTLDWAVLWHPDREADERTGLGDLAAPGPHPRTVEELGPLAGGLPVAIVAEHSS